MSEQLWMLCEHESALPHGFWLTNNHWADCPGGHPVEGGETVWWCRDAFGEVRLLDAPCGGADSAEGCGWRFLIPFKGGERVWWCLEHGVSGTDGIGCYDDHPEHVGRCRMVERFLIPLPNTETEK